MNRDEAIAVVVVADRIRQQPNDHSVELGKLPWHLRRELPNSTNDGIRNSYEVILAGLLKVGIVLGEIDGTDRTFIPWPPSGALDAAMNAWSALGRDPNMGERLFQTHDD